MSNASRLGASGSSSGGTPKNPNERMNLMGETADETAEWGQDLRAAGKQVKKMLSPKSAAIGAATGGVMDAAGLDATSKTVVDKGGDALKKQAQKASESGTGDSAGQQGDTYSFAAGRKRRARSAGPATNGGNPASRNPNGPPKSPAAPDAAGEDINGVSKAALASLGVHDIKKDDLKSPVRGALSMARGGTALNGRGLEKAAEGLGTVLAGPAAGKALGFAARHRKKLVIGLILAFVFQLAAGFGFLMLLSSGGGGDSTEAQAEMASASGEAMEGDGVNRSEIAEWQQYVNGTTLPVEMPIAMQRAYGVTPETDSTDTSDSVTDETGSAVAPASNRVAARPATVDTSQPIGPYGIVWSEAQAMYDELGMSGGTDEDGNPINPMPEPEDLLSEQASAEFLMALLDERVRQASELDPGSSYSTDHFEQGVVLVTKKDGSQDFRLGKSEQDKADQQASESLWTNALNELPTGQADSLADTIYNTALSWRMGDSAACAVAGGTGGTGGAPAGAWGNPHVGAITDDFGPRDDADGLHDGTDIAAGAGTPIYAAGSGTVHIDDSLVSIYGPNWVKIDHGNGVETHYGHMASATVTEGQVVTAGTKIGTEGNIGNVSGPTGNHLHFSVHIDGVTENYGFVDPEKFMADRGVKLGVDDPTRPVQSGSGAGSGGVFTGSNGTAPIPQLGAGQVRLVQANIKQSLPIPSFKADLAKAVATAPDFISLNESWTRERTPGTITPPGYSLWRPAIQAGNYQSAGPAVLWRSSTWREVDHGTYRLTTSPSRLDNRWANWVSLSSTNGEAVSVVSTHLITNPLKPPNPSRQKLYAQGMDKLNDLIRSLQPYGPVLVAGDFNSQAPRTGGQGDPWGPTLQLKQSGMTSTFTALGAPPQGWPTHDGGGTIDYVFYSSGLSPMRHVTYAQNSDHRALVADFAIGSGGGGVAGGGLGSGTSTGVLPTSYTATSSEGASITLDSTSLGYASRISQKANELGMGESATIVAFMVAFVETGFRNLANDGVYQADVDLAYSSEAAARPDLTIAAESMDYPNDGTGTDNDSVGLFQQRNSWGPPKGRIDPYESSGYFFKALAASGAWEAKSLGEAAADVQRPAEKYRYRYGLWEQPARELAAIVRGTAVGGIGECGESSGAVTADASFRVGSFNILSAEETDGNGAPKDNFPDSDKRTPKALAELRNNGITVAGLQEVAGDQAAQIAADGWESYGSGSTVLIWDPTVWTQQSASTLSIPLDGRLTPMPLVELGNANGQTVTFLNVTHSAKSLDDRIDALRRERDLLSGLVSEGKEVVLTGQFNDANDGSSMATCSLHPVVSNVFGGTGACVRPKGDAANNHVFYHGAAVVTDAVIDESPTETRVSDVPIVFTNLTTPGMGGGLPTGDAGAVLNYAIAQVGKGYSQVQRHGPATYDCSGLVVMAYAQIFGGQAATEARIGSYTGNMQDKGQLVWSRADGLKPSTAILQPGDLIFYYSPIKHVALYYGNGKIVHAANPQSGVTIAAYDSMPIMRVVRHLAGS